MHACKYSLQKDLLCKYAHLSFCVGVCSLLKGIATKGRDDDAMTLCDNDVHARRQTINTRKKLCGVNRLVRVRVVEKYARRKEFHA